MINNKRLKKILTRVKWMEYTLVGMVAGRGRIAVMRNKTRNKLKRRVPPYIVLKKRVQECNTEKKTIQTPRNKQFPKYQNSQLRPNPIP